jgi:hypothetical protein
MWFSSSRVFKNDKISAQSADFGFLRFVAQQHMKGIRRILFIGWRYNRSDSHWLL